MRSPGVRPGAGRTPGGVAQLPRVRVARQSDLMAIVRLRTAMRHEERRISGEADDTEWDDARLVATTRRQLQAVTQAFFLAIHEDGSAVGILRCALPPAPSPHAHAVLTTAYVDPACRQAGTLRRLVDAAAAWSARRGVHELRLRAHAANAGANAAWAALGFDIMQVIRRRRD